MKEDREPTVNMKEEDMKAEVVISTKADAEGTAVILREKVMEATMKTSATCTADMMRMRTVITNVTMRMKIMEEMNTEGTNTAETNTKEDMTRIVMKITMITAGIADPTRMRDRTSAAWAA